LALNCASLTDEQDLTARATRSQGRAAVVFGDERSPGRRQDAGSHSSTPSLQLSPIETKALFAPAGPEGGRTVMRKPYQVWLPILLVCLATVAASAQSFRVQCPISTITHPSAANNNSEPAYAGPTYSGTHGYPAAPDHVNGAIKCQQISGGDGYATMGDGTQTYMFSFGPLSGLADIAQGLPGTQFPSVFNTVYSGATLQPGEPATTIDGGGTFTYNGAIGLVPDLDANTTVAIRTAVRVAGIVTVTTSTPHGLTAGTQVVISGVSRAAYNGSFVVLSIVSPTRFTYKEATGNLGAGLGGVVVIPPIDGHVDPRQMLDVGVMNGNIPAPLMAIDEDDEFFLTLSNVGMIMRPDLFEQHTVHFHGYPNASSFYDGVPDASVAINIGGSFTYYYLAPDAGTYFWHCHITPPEHLQMGMVGQIYVRPRQNRVSGSLYAGLQQQQLDLRTKCDSSDILCSNPLPPANNGATGGSMYAYNDGDGSTQYDVEYPLQIHGFDPNFHFVGMTFNPEGFADMKDKYFLLNGRSYPDTVTTGPLETMSTDGSNHYSQPLPAIINIPAGKKALLRISDLDVTEYQTLASLGIPMKVIAINAKLLRDQAGNNLAYNTNSITLAGGESLDVILDTSVAKSDGTAYKAGEVYYLYTPNLDHLSNDAENFGGLMTEVHIN
jgi:FtsP/CotA-like multicopper oxidase with cupredoxin domain